MLDDAVPLRRTWRPNPLALAEYALGEPQRIEQLDQWFGPIERLFAPDPSRPTLFDLFDRRAFEQRAFGSADEAIHFALSLQPDLQTEYREVLARASDLLPRLVPFLANTGGVPFDWKPAASRAGHWSETAEYSDPVQNQWADCWLIAGLSALAWARPEVLNGRLAATGFDPAVRPWHEWQYVGGASLRVEEDLPSGHGGKALHALSSQAGELWPALIEKAWVMDQMGRLDDLGPGANPSFQDYAIQLGNAWFPHQAMARFTQAQARVRSRRDVALSTVLTQGYYGPALCPDGGPCRFPAVAWTPAEDALESDELVRYKTKHRIWPQHAYTVLGMLSVRTTPSARRQSYVVLRDPLARQDGPSVPVAGLQNPWGVALDEPGIVMLTFAKFNMLFVSIGWIE